MKEMKNSGIEWIGQIPSHWETTKLKIIATIIRGGSPRPIDAYLTDASDGFNWIKIGDTRKGYKYIDGTKQKIIAEGVSKSRVVHKGDLLLTNSMSFGEPYILNIDGCIHDGWVSFTDYNGVDINFLYYILSSPLCLIQFKQQVDGGVVQNLNINKIGTTNVFLPPLPEQKAIADFLDKQCAEIDSVIERTKATIEEYKKLKQSIITEAVTKGVRAERPMKDSGIEWIGEIPSEWDTSKLKFESTFKQNKYSVDDGSLNYIGLENIVAWNGQYIDSDSQYDREQSLVCDKDDILFGKLRPYLAKVFICPFKQCCSGEFCVITVHKQNNRFIWYQLISHGFIFMVDRSTYGTKMPRANADYIKNMQIAIPSIDEQEEIVLYLDQKCAEIDTLIEKKTKLLEEMEALKKSIIFEYVTGKKTL